MIIPPDMGKRYRRFLDGRGDVVESLISLLGEDDGARTRTGAWAALVLSRIYLVQGKLDLSLSYLRLSLRVFNSLDEEEYPLGLWVNRALIYKYSGEYSSAVRLLRTVYGVSLRRGQVHSAAKASSNLASILARRGSLEEADSYLNFTRKIYEESGSSEENRSLNLTRAVIDIRRNRFPKAIDTICNVLTESQGPAFRRDRLTAGFLLLEVFIRMEDMAAAEDALINIAKEKEGLEKFSSKRMTYFYLYSLVARRKGNDQEARKYHERGEALRKKLGIASPGKWMPDGEKRNILTGDNKRILKDKSVAEKDSLFYSRSILSNRKTRDNEFVTVDESMKTLLKRIKEVSSVPLPILLRGDTGTGKDVIARMIHGWSGRNDHPFISVNVAALASSLFESSFFGHVKGAFTGAVKYNMGFVEAAGNGTIFLDEIGELELALQAKLLRYLDSGEYLVVGESKVKRGSARIIAATNRNLESAVEKGAFRIDLYHRLNVFNFRIPPLADRNGDIEILTDYFIRKARCDFNIAPLKLSENAREVLARYSWPGNVRELQNEIIRVLFKAESGFIRASDLSYRILAQTVISNNTGHSSLDERIAAMEKEEIVKALRKTRGNRSMAARLLGLERTTLIYRINRYGLN
jgi:DNA-binding NtrC family response regulator/tetratricopeptide (TPR) repeat protein